MEGKWTTNHGDFYFGKVNYSWKLYWKFPVPKVALRMIFSQPLGPGSNCKWVAITFGIFPLHIQCPNPTYFSGTKYSVTLPKPMDLQTLFWVIRFITTLHWRATESVIVIVKHTQVCTHTHTQNIRRHFFLLGSRWFILRNEWPICLWILIEVC